MTVSETVDSMAVGLEALLAAVRADDPKREIAVRVGDLMKDLTALTAALSDQAETIRACARSTLIGFQTELGDRNIEFICGQIAQKATMGALSDQVVEREALLREALEAATFKLALYRAAHRDEPIGGMEYGR